MVMRDPPEQVADRMSVDHGCGELPEIRRTKASTAAQPLDRRSGNSSLSPGKGELDGLQLHLISRNTSAL